MNEWKRLLEQTHPSFQITVEEALAEEIQVQEQSSELIETQQKAALASAQEDKAISEIEWISPTFKLQKKIENIPDKMAFKIGEAADYVGVKQYVLRYWESEFDILQPKKSKNGQRMYSKRDVETALLIKKLLHEDRFSIEGAQSALRKLRKQVKDKPQVEESNTVIEAKNQDNHLSSDLSFEFAQSLLENIRTIRETLNL